ncbi:MAG: RNA recognition motif domain-containing protein [Ginsengibacter sp.]
MNIYVSNLSFNVQDEDLKEFFTPYGEVTSAKVITERETGRSRGFGFVEMTDETASKKAITELNGATVENRAISVSVAKPREARPSSGRNFNNGNSYNRNRY